VHLPVGTGARRGKLRFGKAARSDRLGPERLVRDDTGTDGGELGERWGELPFKTAPLYYRSDPGGERAMHDARFG
jgi:hypothetical protein